MEVCKRIAAYADLCVQRESHGNVNGVNTKGVNWAAHLQNVGLDLNLLALDG